MECFFDIYGYMEILEGVTVFPHPTLSNSKTEEITTWKKKDRMITFVLLLTIDSLIKPIISAYSTGAAQWKALCDKYDKQNDTSYTH
jgi:hypothetical protein